MKIVRTQVEGRPRPTKGFTLIELLVVISIVGLLSSVVMAATASARKNGNDAAIMQELTQFRNLYELAFSESGGYSSLQILPTTPVGLPCDHFDGPTGFFCTMTNLADCTNVFGSTGIISNNQTAFNLCKNIVANSGYFYIGIRTNTNMAQKYSIAAYLPSRNKYMCMGSSKTNSIVSSVHYNNLPSAIADTTAGCSSNP